MCPLVSDCFVLLLAAAAALCVQKCQCGAPNCAGTLGGKKKSKEDMAAEAACGGGGKKGAAAASKAAIAKAAAAKGLATKRRKIEEDQKAAAAAAAEKEKKLKKRAPPVDRSAARAVESKGAASSGRSDDGMQDVGEQKSQPLQMPSSAHFAVLELEDVEMESERKEGPASASAVFA